MIIRIIANRVIICDILAIKWQVMGNGANRDRLHQIYKRLCRAKAIVLSNRLLVHINKRSLLTPVDLTILIFPCITLNEGP